MEQRERSTAVPGGAGWLAGTVALGVAATVLVLATWWAVRLSDEARLPISAMTTSATTVRDVRCASARLAPGCQAPPCERPGSPCVVATAGPAFWSVGHRVDRRAAAGTRPTPWWRAWTLLASPGAWGAVAWGSPAA